MTATFALGLLRRTGASNKSQPFVSIVVAARNEEDFIANCLKSLSNQTYPIDSYEIIVVDDESTDRTREIVETFKRVRCLAPSVEFAAFAAKKRPMATGIAKARGELILTTDADCTVPETWIETMVAHFESDVSVVAGYSQMAPWNMGMRISTITLGAVNGSQAASGMEISPSRMKRYSDRPWGYITGTSP